jgi:hypothetical protein
MSPVSERNGRSDNGTKCMSENRRRGRPALWDPSRDDPDYHALELMLEWAKTEPIKPYALARKAIAVVRTRYEWGSILEQLGFLELSKAALVGMLSEVKQNLEAADKEEAKRMVQIGEEAVASGGLRVIEYPPYRYGDDFIHIKRLGNKFQDLLGEAECSLFLKDFPDGHTEDDIAGYCRTAEEKRQEALRIIKRLLDEQSEDEQSEDEFA